MAEYYPLLAKAVAGLQNSTPEVRRAVYERAHKALLAQLGNLDPPIAESDVARETEALADAVARLEAELSGVNDYAGDSQGASAQKPSSQKASSQAAPPQAASTQAAPRQAASSRIAASVEPTAKAATRPAPPQGAPMPRPIPPSRREAGPMSGQAAPPQAAPSQGISAQRVPGEGLPSAAARPPRPPLSASLPPAGKFTARQKLEPSEEREPSPVAAPTVGTPEPPARRTTAAAARAAHAGKRDEPDTDLGPDLGSESFEVYDHDEDDFADLQNPRVEAARLYAPQPETEESRSNFRLWLVGGIVAVVVAIVAVAAWSLRDRPDELAKLKPAAPAQSEKAGKIVERIGGASKPDDTGPSLSPNSVPAPANAQQTAPPQPNVLPAPQSTAAATAAPKAGDATQAVPVAYRAALLVEAPEEPNKVKTYVGTVVWRLDNVSSGSGQPLGTAVHADIDIPADKLKVGLTLQKNTDPSLPASHTMTIDFTVQPDTATGGIKQISLPQLREDDAAKGDSLVGVTVPIMDNSFLIGLSRGAAEATNLGLIKSRAWIDVPILLGNGKIAKLTFEKGASGARAIDDALAAWQTQ